MAWNIRSSRVRKVEEHLERVGMEPRAAEEKEAVDEALRRQVAVAELVAAACIAHACGHDINETAAGLLGRFRAFPDTEWSALFDEARASAKRTSSDRDWPARSEALEELIAALQAGT